MTVAKTDEAVPAGYWPSATNQARTERLFTAERAALRRRSSAKGWLTQARKSGDPQQLRQAHERVTATEAEYAQVAQAASAELDAIRHMETDGSAGARGELERARAASNALLRTLAVNHAR